MPEASPKFWAILSAYPMSAIPGSVTMSAFLAPSCFACSPALSDAPAPVIIVCGSVSVVRNFRFPISVKAVQDAQGLLLSIVLAPQ